MRIQKSVMVTKEASELGDASADLVIELIRAKRNDGKIDTQEMITIIMGLSKNFGVAIEGLEKIDDEAKEDAYAFSLAWAAAGQRVHDAVKNLPPVKEIPEEFKSLVEEE